MTEFSFFLGELSLKDGKERDEHHEAMGLIPQEHMNCDEWESRKRQL